MPFEIITTPSVALTGPVSSGDFVVVRMTTRSRLLFSPYRHRYGEMRLQLSRETWTKEIRDQVAAVSADQGRRGRPPMPTDFSVILSVGSVLAIGHPVTVTVIYGRYANKEYQLRLRGTPSEFHTGRSAPK